jgi:hypothetical protein
MTDWAAWGTATGTLVLAGAIFAAVRSSNRSARVAERALLAGLRPVLAATRPGDPGDQVQFADGRVFELAGGRALVRVDGDVVYLAMPLRNVGAGMAVLRAHRLEGQSAAEVERDPLGPARHRRGDAARIQPRSPNNSATFTSPPATSVSGRRRPVIPRARATARSPRRCRPAVASRPTCFSPTTRLASRPSPRFVLLPDGNDWRCDVTRLWTR